MKTLLKILSFLALLIVIVPPAAYLAGKVEKPMMGILMLVGTIVWFLTVPFWMGGKKDA